MSKIKGQPSMDHELLVIPRINKIRLLLVLAIEHPIKSKLNKSTSKTTWARGISTLTKNK